MAVVSDNLIHFLGKKCKDSPNEQFEVFKKIVINGLKLSENNISYGQNGTVTNHIACFTDIPLNQCDEHIAQYGRFGIGFKKQSIKKVGGHPARYFIDSNNLAINGSEPDISGAMQTNLQCQLDMVLRIKEASKRVDSLELVDQTGQQVVDPAFLKEWLGLQLTVLSFDKETGEPETPDAFDDLYYKEREWRLVPLRGNRGLEPESIEQIRKDEADNFFYNFNRTDVNMILTPCAEVRVSVIRFLNELGNKTDVRLREFAENPLSVIAYDDLCKW